MSEPGFHQLEAEALPEPSLRFLGGRRFRLLTAFRFVDTVEPREWTIRVQRDGESSDLASSPPWL